MLHLVRRGRPLHLLLAVLALARPQLAGSNAGNKLVCSYDSAHAARPGIRVSSHTEVDINQSHSDLYREFLNHFMDGSRPSVLK
jgi:hypothetical protein